MARPHYVTLASGQMRCWRGGAGAPLALLPSPAEGAAAAADRVAARFPGHEVVCLEWPGTGGSADLPFATLDDLARLVGEALVALGLAEAPLLAGDLAGTVAGRLRRPFVLAGAATAARWAARGVRPPALAPRPDGTHLTALWAFLRDVALLDPADGLRPDPAGAALPTPGEMDSAVVAAAVRPEAFERLWGLCIDGAAGDFESLAARHGARLVDNPASIGGWPTLVASAPAPATKPAPGIWCDYVDTPEARVHLRRAGTAARPLMVLQSAPGSAAPLAEVILGLARTRSVIAPDYPGNGDSGKPEGPVDIAHLGGMMLSVADALGLAEFDLWGTHTGALVALEMALQRPERIGRLVMEAPPLLGAAFSEDILANYLPPLRPDRWGLHLQQAWNMRRDMFTFWPWYRDSRAAIRPLGLPDTRMLHDWTVGLLKSGTTYDRSYRAAFEYPTRERLPLLARPALVCAGPTDMLADALEGVARLGNPAIEVDATPATVWYPNQGEEARRQTIARYLSFLA